MEKPPESLEQIQQEVEQYSYQNTIDSNAFTHFTEKLEKSMEGDVPCIVEDYNLAQTNLDAMKKKLGIESFIEEKTIDKTLHLPIEKIKSFIEKHFSEDFLDRCLLGQIIIDTETTVIVPTKKENILKQTSGAFFVPNSKVEEWLNVLNSEEQKALKEMCRRARNMSFYRDVSGIPMYYKKYFLSPVIIYSQKFSTDHIQELNYLDNIEEGEKRETYILGSLSHEVGHNVYNNLILDKDIQHDWINLIDKIGNITKYAASLEKNGFEKDYDENFAEAMRIYTTNPNFLENNFLEVFNFISQNFPDIKK